MKMILAAVLCTAASIGQVSTASAQYYGPHDYGYGPGHGHYAQFDPRNQPMGWGEPYPATPLPDGRLGCAHRNYRPVNGWCQRAW
jgi:hypothetical protein